MQNNVQMLQEQSAAEAHRAELARERAALKRRCEALQAAEFAQISPRCVENSQSAAGRLLVLQCGRARDNANADQTENRALRLRVLLTPLYPVREAASVELLRENSSAGPLTAEDEDRVSSVDVLIVRRC